jgi:hypothetical protein
MVPARATVTLLLHEKRVRLAQYQILTDSPRLMLSVEVGNMQVDADPYRIRTSVG